MKRIIASLAAFGLGAGSALAQGASVPDNLEKLGKFQTTGVTEFTYVEQGGDYAAGIKATLEKI